MIKIFGLLETIILFILSYLIPKNNSLTIFGSRKGEYILGNPKIFYLYLSKKHNTKLNLLFYDRNNANMNTQIKTFNNSIKKYWYLLRANYIIIDNFSFDVGHNGVFVGNFNLIQTRHGEPIKGIGFLSKQYVQRRSKVVLFFEKLEYKTYSIILSNFNTADIMSRAFNNSNNVRNIGLPRNDLLTHPEIQELCKNSNVKSKIGDYRKNYSKIYFLAPTFREQTSQDYFTKVDIENLNMIFKKQKSLLLIKTHPRETRNFLNDDTTNIKNITQILPYDATDFLAYVDVVITDYSSIYIDFLLTGKPIIWYQNDLNDYLEKERGMLYPPKEVVISESTAYNFKELLSILDNLDTIQSNKNYKENYKKLKEKFYGENIGNISSCEQLTNLLYPKL